EPGMLIERLADVQELRERLDGPAHLRFTIDVGHALCNEDDSPEDVIRAGADHLVHIQIEDMRRGVHEHLPFGEGELDLTAAISALLDIDYQGLVSVELGRHGPTAPTTAADSIRALQAAIASAQNQHERLPGRQYRDYPDRTSHRSSLRPGAATAHGDDRSHRAATPGYRYPLSGRCPRGRPRRHR